MEQLKELAKEYPDAVKITRDEGWCMEADMPKDQLYFVDKNKDDGASELYSISDFSTRTTENVRKGYLLGKYGATPNVEIEEVE